MNKLNDATPEDWNKLNEKGKVSPELQAKSDKYYQGLFGEPEPFEEEDAWLFGEDEEEWVEEIDRLSASQQQVGGTHYIDMPVQPLEIVREMEGMVAFQGACLTKIYKYCMRKKGSRLQNFKKAQHILNWLVEEHEKLEAQDREWERQNGIY